MIDMHSHILPGIDDGAENVKEALTMLEDAYKKGCSTVVATPHLRAYSEEEIEEALKMRDMAYENLMSEAKKGEAVIPEIKLGFEVLLDKEITVFPSFRKLCIEGTNAMLVEMPMHHWDAFALSRIDNLKKEGILPIIAHLDRYIVFKKNLERVLSMEGVIYQFNAEAFLGRHRLNLIKKTLKMGKTVVVGSDMHHSAGVRRSRLYEAYRKMIGKRKDYEAVFEGNAHRILFNK